MQALMNSYEKLKGKFNTFAAKCLSERQKRESGLLLVAPPLSLPGDIDMENEQDPSGGALLFNGGISNLEETKQKENISQISAIQNSKMGGRLGLKMEKALKKEDQVGIQAAHNQTVRQEEESMLLNPDDDEPAVIEEESMAGIG